MMTDLDALLSQISGLRRDDAERWVVNQWVRPDNREGRYIFHEIDVARIQLILDLRDELQVNEEAMPVVLSLLDQLYDLRRRVHELSMASGEVMHDHVRQELKAALNPAGPRD